MEREVLTDEKIKVNDKKTPYQVNGLKINLTFSKSQIFENFSNLQKVKFPRLYITIISTIILATAVI